MNALRRRLQTSVVWICQRRSIQLLPFNVADGLVSMPARLGHNCGFRGIILLQKIVEAILPSIRPLQDRGTGELAVVDCRGRQIGFLVRPSFSSATSSQEREIVISEHHRPIHTPFERQSRARSHCRQVDRARCKEAPVFHGATLLQHFAARTYKGIVLGVVTKAAHRHWATDRLGICRNNRFDRVVPYLRHASGSVTQTFLYLPVCGFFVRSQRLRWRR